MTTVVAMGLCWWLDHHWLTTELNKPKDHKVTVTLDGKDLPVKVIFTPSEKGKGGQLDDRR